MQNKLAIESKMRALLLLVAWMGIAGLGRSQSADPAASWPQAPAPWPGAVYRIQKVERLDDSHAVIHLNLYVQPKSPTVALGHPPDLEPTPLSTQPAGKIDTSIEYYSFAASTLECAATSKTYGLDSKQTLFRAPQLIMAVQAGSGVFLPLDFFVPPPLPPKPDGTRPPQIVTLHVEGSQVPIRNIEIPSEAAAH